MTRANRDVYVALLNFKSNTDYIDEEYAEMQALSHFSYHDYGWSAA